MRRWIAWGVLLQAVLPAAAGCAGTSGKGGMEVTYAVTIVGTNCPADITYQALDAQPTALSGQALPWRYDFTVPSKQVNGFPLSLTATIPTTCVPATVTANIVVNGALYASATGTAAFPAVAQATLF